MYKKTIPYTDYNGVEQKEDWFFNLNKVELMEMESGVKGGLSNMLIKLGEATENVDTSAILKIFKELILKAVGEKSEDGKRFIKKRPDGTLIADEFEQTEAFSNLFYEVVSDQNAAAEFFNNIIPADMRSQVQANKAKHPANK